MDIEGGAEITYGYNSRGLLGSRTSGSVTDTFGYDALGRMTLARRKVGGSTKSTVTFAYDALGRMTKETVAIPGVSKTIAYEYDQADRRTKMTLPAPSSVVLDYTYTSGGEPNTISRGGAVLVDYDYTGPAVSRRRVTSGLDPNVHVDWWVTRDPFGRMTASGNYRAVGADPNDWPVLAAFGYARAAMGIPTGETYTPPVGASQVKQFGYDSLDRLTRVYYGPDPNTDPCDVFNLDLLGNRTTCWFARTGEDPNYASNADNQYTAIDPGQIDPNYDAAGNLVDDHRSYSYTYDHDNRLTNVKKSGAVDVDYEYDALGRRLKMVDLSHSPLVVVRFYLSSGQNVVAEYDASANRKRYYVHGPTYIDERVVVHDEASNKDYVYLTKDLYTVAGLADEKGWLVESYDYDAYGEPIMSACAILPYAADYDGDGDVDGDDQTVFEAHHNGPGNSPSGTAGWRSDFDCDGDVDGSDHVLFAHAYNGADTAPRGDMTLMTGSMVVSRAANPYFFTGRRLDVYDIQDANTPNHFTDDKAGLVLYYYRARTMDAVLGRFLQRDPLGVAWIVTWGTRSGEPHVTLGRLPIMQYLDGLNTYSYAREGPAWHFDPEGLITQQQCKELFDARYKDCLGLTGQCFAGMVAPLGTEVVACIVGCAGVYRYGGPLAARICVVGCGGAVTIVTFVRIYFCLEALVTCLDITDANNKWCIKRACGK